MIEALLKREPAVPWSHGGKIPWSAPAFSARMLREHLSQEHDRASRRATVIDEQVAWIHEVPLGGRSGRVLDLGCGPGFYSSRLATLGHSCVGVDFSPASIQYATKIASQQKLSCRYMLSDLEHTALGGPYDAALFLFGELNTFRPKVAGDLLSRIRAALAPGARVILEVHTEEAVRSLGSSSPSWSAYASSVFADEPHLVLRECSWHESDSTSVDRRFVFRVGSDEPDVLVSTTQAYSTEAYAELLREAGLEELQRFPSLTGRSLAADPTLFVIIAGASGAV